MLFLPLAARLRFAAAALLAVAASGASAQPVFEVLPHTGEVRIPEPPDPAASSVAEASASLLAGSITWNLTYRDIALDNGIGFDGPDGPAAKAALEAALVYIGGILDHSGTVDYEVRVSQTDGTGVLATGGTFFPGATTGFLQGYVQHHIVTGTDPNAGQAFDGSMTVDFGFPYNFDHTQPPQGWQYDFFSAMLHEVAHSLGFLSLTRSTGLGLGNIDARGELDRRLETGDGFDLFDDAGSGAFLGTADQLAGLEGGLVFDQFDVISYTGNLAPSYAPNPFVQGSSLSHFDFAVSGSVMHPAISSGVMKRTYAPADLAGFRMLGYSLLGDLNPNEMLQSPNEEAGGTFGISVAGAPDVTGDGLGDVITGAYLEDPGAAPSGSGRVYAHGGATGALRRQPVSPSPAVDGNAGRNVQSMADITGDGRNEILVGSWQENAPGNPAGSGRAHVFNGSTDALIRTLDSASPEAGGRFGARVSAMGDVNSDGVQEIAVGAPNEDPGASPQDSGRAYIFSGATGVRLRTLVSPNAQTGGLFGFFLAGTTDFTGDGKGDVAVGAYKEETGGQPADCGRVHVFNGATGALVRSIAPPAPEAGGQFGRNLARLFDVTGDGIADLLIAAPAETAGGEAGAGRIHLYNGFTGAFLRTLESPSPQAGGQFGIGAQSIPDITGDGKGEVIAGAPSESFPGGPAGAGTAYIISGGDGVLIKAVISPNAEAGGAFGCFVHGVPDADEDGLWEMAVGARNESPGASPDGAGRVYLFRSRGY